MANQRDVRRNDSACDPRTAVTMSEMTRRTAIAAITATSAIAAGTIPAVAEPFKPDLQELLARLKPVRGVISADNVRAAGLPKSELMNRLIPWAASYADPPISHFTVGAVMEGASGALYAGMNLEFPGQTLAFTIHGEGAATANAWMNGESAIVSLAVGGVPCGYCRQYLAEFVPALEKLTIWMPAGGSITLAEAMPHAFLPSVLGITTDPFHAHAELAVRADDPLVQAAAGAARRSHAPYSKTLAGVALRMKDGSILTGRHAENVAFNPAMPALQCALIAVRLAGHTYVETAGRASQRTATEAVLRTISSAPLIYALAAVRS
jgi:cytidine deaminase